MDLKRRIYNFILLLVTAFPLAVSAQDNTSSPYSVFGVGDLANVAYGRNLALGGTGFALRSPNYLNLKNPASLTTIDTLTTLFETGVFLKITKNSTTEESNTLWDGNLTHLALGNRYNSWLMGCFGLMPYSDIGYYFLTEEYIIGDDENMAYTTWEGSGGITRFFYSLGIKIGSKLSLGVDLSYYYGIIKQELTTYTTVASSSETVQAYTNRYNSFSIKPAFQFSTNLGDKGSSFIVGGMYIPTHNFFGEATRSIQQYYNSVVFSIDDEDDLQADKIKVPATYGGGVSLTLRNKILFTADIEASPWSVNGTRDYKDQQIYSLGIERLPRRSLNYFNNCSYRIGFRYDSGYFKAKRYAIDDTRFMFGAGFPVKKSRSTLNVSFEFGQRGTRNMGLFRERYSKISVAFSFHDYWFIKRKIE